MSHVSYIGSLPFFFPQTVLPAREPAKGAGKEQKQGTTQTKTAMVEFNTEPECAYFLAKFHEQTASAIGPGPLQVRSLQLLGSMCVCAFWTIPWPLCVFTNAFVSFESYGLVVLMIIENLMYHPGVSCSHLCNIRYLTPSRTTYKS